MNLSGLCAKSSLLESRHQSDYTPRSSAACCNRVRKKVQKLASKKSCKRSTGKIIVINCVARMIIQVVDLWIDSSLGAALSAVQ